MRIHHAIGAGFLIALLQLTSCDLLDIDSDGASVSTQPTESEIVAGLRGALSVGIDTAATRVSTAGGYFRDEIIKILLPDDVEQALDFADDFKARIDNVSPWILQTLSVAVFDFSVFTGMRDSLSQSINSAAEHAAPLSVVVFKDAIRDISIIDGMTILRGDSTEATDYLESRTFDALVDVYSPFVDSTLTLVGAHRLWSSVATSYNAMAAFHAQANLVVPGLPALPFDTLTTDLASYCTGKALNGLFIKVGEQEALIRRDPLARVTDILKKVFNWLDEQV